MKIIYGNLWDQWDQGAYVVITTNQIIKKDGTAVMGAGVALQAAQRFPELPAYYGQKLRDGIQWTGYVPGRLLLCPTKKDFRFNSTIELVEKSLVYIKMMATKHPDWVIACPPLGCGNGRLNWDTQVKPRCERFLGEINNVNFVLPRQHSTTWVHKNKASYNIYVGRQREGMHYGNIASHKESEIAAIHVATREEAIQAYADWLAGTAHQQIEPERRLWILRNIPYLKGKILGCWCAPEDCHARILAELADGRNEDMEVTVK